MAARQSIPLRSTAGALRALALGAALHASAARAEVQPEAAPILDKLVAATGGSDARTNERTLRLKGRIEAIGLTGRWEMWLAAPDRWTRHLTLGSLRFREGYDGEVAWRTDLSGKTVTIQGASELEDAREEGWFLNERWALPDQGGGRVRRGSRSYRAGVEYDMLQITPPVGQPRRFYVSAKTGFIERMTREVDQHTVEEHPRNYKTLGGRKRPSVYQSPTLLPSEKPIERMTVDSVWVNPAVDPTRFSPPDLVARRIAWQGVKGAIQVPFTYGSKAVLVKVSINGAPPANFILDTGASLTCIDKNYARDVGITAEGDATVQGIAASSGMRFGRVVSIALAGRRGAQVALRDFRAALLDFSEGTRPVLWRKAHGLLGADFLSRFVVEIDYDSLTVRLHDPTRFRSQGAGQPIPFELHQGIPVVEMTLDGTCTGKFLVDVGNSFHTTVHGSMVRSCRMFGRRKRKEVEVSGGGIGGGFTSTLCRLDSLRLGPFSWTEPVAALALHTRGGIGSKDFAGNIGNDLLERFRCTYDYSHRTLYLEPGRRYGHRDKVSRLGVMLVRLEHQVYAGTVITGSAGYEAGLRWYDEIVAIDGRPALKWTREELDRVLEEGEVGSVHRITYRRWLEDEDKTVEVKLRDVL
jgi:hypothetical protein